MGYLKGVCHEIFDLHFFHDLNPSRPLINRLKYFRIRFRFRQDIRIFKKIRGVKHPRLHGVHHTTESSNQNFSKSSAVCIPPWSQALRCASHRGVKVTKFLKKLCGVHPTMESDSAVCFPLQSQTPRCASHSGVKLRGVLPTTKSSSAVCITPRSQNQNLYESLGAFRGTIRRNPFRSEQFYHVRKDLKM